MRYLLIITDDPDDSRYDESTVVTAGYDHVKIVKPFQSLIGISINECRPTRVILDLQPSPAYSQLKFASWLALDVMPLMGGKL